MCDDTDHVTALEAEVRHLRAGIKAYRSVLTIAGERHPYSVVENKNLPFVRAWEQIDQTRTALTK